MKIYTKTGDRGETSLLGGQRVSKNNPRLETYGTLDELNAHVGSLIAKIKKTVSIAHTETKTLIQIQEELFIIGSLVACANKEDIKKFKLPEFNNNCIQDLENSIDLMESALPKLKNFILPGGSEASAQAHVCRTVCRRAERLLISIDDTVDLWLIFLNRLSDYFFVLARHLNSLQSIDDIIWNTKA